MVIRRFVARAAAVSWTAALLAALVTPAAHAAKPSNRPAAPALTAKPSTPTNETSATFAWNAASGTTYTCSLDGAKATACTTPKTYTGLTDRGHSFAVRATTGTGKANTSTPTSHSWTVDTLAPAAPSVMAPPTPTRNTQASVSFSDSDATVAGFTCALDAAVAQTCQSPFTATGLGSGTHTLVVSARDAAGNIASAAPVSWVVDLSAPLAAVVTAPAAYSSSASVSVPFGSDDAGATYTCALDSAPAAACTTPFVADQLAEGAHKLTIVATDGVGNVGTPVSVAWTVDTVAPPTPHLVTGPAPRTNQHAATIVFSLPEIGSAAECRVDADAWAPCTSPWTSGALTDTTHTVDVRALDLAGNASAANSSAFLVDSLAPAPAQIFAGPNDPSNDLAPGFSIIETDPSTVAFACTLDGGAEFDCTDPDPLLLNSAPEDPANPDPKRLSGDGQHVLTVVALDAPYGDATANRSEAVSWTWLLDTVAPTQPTAGAGAAFPTVTGSSLTMPISTDPGTTTSCLVDGVVIACSGSVSVTGLGTGTHTLTIKSTDAAGNLTSNLYTWTVDATAPTATLAKPTTITGYTKVTFSEKVVGAAGVVLQVASDTTHRNVASRSCRSASGAVVSCTGLVRAVVLRPLTYLVPGQSYKAYVPTTVKDKVGNVARISLASFRGALAQQENSPAVTQSWRRVATTAAYGGSYVTARSAGATASYTFSGTSITWYAVTGPTQGVAKVYVDGVLKATVNNYASATHYKVARVVKGLTNKTHTLRILVTGTKGSSLAKGTQVSVDAVRVGANAVTSSPALRTTWRAVSVNGRRWVVSNQAGDSLSMRFRGTAISLATILGPDRGIAQIKVDGAVRLTFDGYASSVKYGVVKTVSGLTNTLHTVQIVVTGKKRTAAKGTTVAVDFLRVA